MQHSKTRLSGPTHRDFRRLAKPRRTWDKRSWNDLEVVWTGRPSWRSRSHHAL